MANLQTTTILFCSLLLLQASPSGAVTISSGQMSATPVVNSEERQRGIELYRQNKFTEAAELLRKAVKTSDSDDVSWYYLGLALLHQPKELKEASKSFEKALKLHPDFAGAHTGLGFSLVLRNKYSEAMREAQTALSIDPNIADAHYVIGIVHLRAGEHEKALDQAESAIKINPQFPSAYLLKSQALVGSFGNVVFQKQDESQNEREIRFIQAADALEKYLRLDPNAKDQKTWTEQLESLRFHVALYRTKENKEVFSGKEVTTKARVLSKPAPDYSPEARGAQVTGIVVLRAVFAADGTVKHFLVVKGLPYGLTEAAVRAARKIKFAPATIDGRPVSMFIQLEYNFHLY